MAKPDEKPQETKTTEATAQPLEVSETEEGTEQVGGEETSDGEEGETSEESGDDLSEAELAESKNLYKLLKDPATAKSVIAALAARHDLFSNQTAPVPKSEEAHAVKEIKDLVKEALGPEYNFISEKLSSAIEKIVSQERALANQQFAELQRSNIERDVVTSYDELARETKGDSKRFENRMAQLSNEIPIGSQDVRTYIRRLYALASSERKSSPQKVADQIRRNASDAGARLQGGAAGTGSEGMKIPDKKMSLDESIAFAVAQQQGGGGKRK